MQNLDRMDGEWMVGIAFIMVHTTTIATAIVIACRCWMPFATSNVTATRSHQRVLGFAGVREVPSNQTNDDAAEPAHYYRNARLSVHLTKDSTHHLDTPNIQVWID
jgi:hypothetical protein